MGKNQDPGEGINIPDPQHWLQYKNRLIQIMKKLKKLIGTGAEIKIDHLNALM